MTYTAILTRPSPLLWRASVPALPDCVIEAPTRGEALKKIQQRIIEVMNHLEFIQIDVDLPPTNAQPQTHLLTETPWQWYGIGKGDSSWGEMFDEIEKVRQSN